MYCGQCGKKVMENMLFCPFCGSPIVIPEQDRHPEPDAEPVQETVAAAEPAAESVEAAPAQETYAEPADIPEEPQKPVSLFADVDEKPKAEPVRPQETFVPLSFSFEEQLEECARAENEPEPEPEAEEQEAPAANPEPEANISHEVMEELRRPVRRGSPELRRPENMSKRAANTFIPIKEIDPDDMFMDGFDDEDDDYDLDDEPSRSRYHDDDFDFEEPEHGSFFQRHIRGIVGLILLLIMLVICAAWAFSPKGQETLARVNLAWTAKPYADLGYEAYQQKSELLAARYYEKALARDEDNYEYAHSAMVAYYGANEIESAAEMLKKCIEMDPDNPEPYQEMIILYPDQDDRPWEIKELIRLGFQRTGHPALDVS